MYQPIPTVINTVNRSFTPGVSFMKPPTVPSTLRISTHSSPTPDFQRYSNITPSDRSTTNIPTSFSRYRKPVNNERPEKQITSDAIVSQKGVMNDTIGTPDDVMEAFLYPPANTTPHAQHENFDNQTKIRYVLTERERVILRLLRRRRAELAAMPLGMTEQTRRNAIIEAKQLSLLEMQRVVRNRVCTEMKKMYSLAIQEDRFVPPDHLSRLFRRRDPPIYSYTDGYPRITPFDSVPEMPPRHPETIAKDSIRMAEFDKSRMVSLKVQRRKDFQAKLVLHYNNFKTAISEAKSARARIWKNFERYLIEKRRAEERRRKVEQIERVRLLRSNDEEAYLKLLENTKNERLLQLVRQTDSYLMRIGAQVEREREKLEGTEGLAHNTFNEELKDKDAVPLDAMRRRRDLYYTITHSVLEEVRQPSIMVHGTLKAYQVDGLRWMVSLYNNNLNGILADEMGLGKTIQTISLITYLVESKNNPGPFLIIVPLSTMGNWVRELDLWAPSLTKIIYRGDKAKRKSMQQTQMAGGNYNVVLTTYEFTVKDQNILSPIYWQYIIIDEGHRMKNANCKLAMTLGVKYKSRNRLLLTGTPLQNNLTELWALLNFLLPKIFASADTFETWFKRPFESTALGDSADLEEEETLLVINRLHQVLRPFLLRRLKTDVESQLPQKVEHVLPCAMSSWQKVIYRQIMNRIGLATGRANGVRAFNNLLMQCKKVCNHPYLFYDFEAIASLPQDCLIRASGKFHVLHHMLPKLRLHGHRTLIFSQMTAALDYLEYFLNVVGIQHLRLDGGTKADERQTLLNKFNEKDSPYFCFLLSTRAGGLGLNLQTADTVIIFDSDWNPMMDLQAQDRAHRIGQTKVVRVFRLICPSTVEEKILEQANRKLQVDAQVIQAGQFNNKSTEMDRHQMLRDILRTRNEEDGTASIPVMEELNRLFAQNDDEYEAFVKYDTECNANGSFKPIFVEEEELPGWVLQPEMNKKTAEEKEQEVLLSHGRGRRKRKAKQDLDSLTEAEWLSVMEGDSTVEEVFEKRKKRRESRQSDGRKSAEASDARLLERDATERKEPEPSESPPVQPKSNDASDDAKSGFVDGRQSVDLEDHANPTHCPPQRPDTSSSIKANGTNEKVNPSNFDDQRRTNKKSSRSTDQQTRSKQLRPVFVKLRIREPETILASEGVDVGQERPASSTRKRRRSQKAMEMANGSMQRPFNRHSKKHKSSSSTCISGTLETGEGASPAKLKQSPNQPKKPKASKQSPVEALPENDSVDDDARLDFSQSRQNSSASNKQNGGSLHENIKFDVKSNARDTRLTSSPNMRKQVESPPSGRRNGIVHKQKKDNNRKLSDISVDENKQSIVLTLRIRNPKEERN